jgi:sugar-specific transcriptional regulator TrmB
MSFKKELINSGLKEKEALIYDILIDKGLTPVKPIIQESGLKKGIIYKVLYDLEKKKLVSQKKVSGALHFQAEHPYNLLELKDKELDLAKKNYYSINDILPLLVTTYKTGGGKPGFQYFTGTDGVKEAILDTLNYTSDVSAIFQAGDVEPEVYKWFEDFYWEERAKKKIKINVIVSKDYLTNSYTQTNSTYLRETRVVPNEKFGTGAVVLIYAEKVSFINMNKNSELFAITVSSQFIHETLKSLFDLAWESAEKYSNRIKD